MMSIQGQTLEVRVAGCNKLKDTKWVSKQKPYVSIEYGSSKFLSSICTDGGTNPTFQEKNRIMLVEGLRELNVSVWSSNTMTYDNLIGSARVQLQKVLSEGFDDTPWTILSKTNRCAGEVCLVMHYSNANKPMTGFAVPYPPQQVPLYYVPPPASAPPQPSMYNLLKHTLKHTIKQLPYPLHVNAPQASYPPQPYPPHCYPPNPHQAYPPQN